MLSVYEQLFSTFKTIAAVFYIKHINIFYSSLFYKAKAVTILYLSVLSVCACVHACLSGLLQKLEAFKYKKQLRFDKNPSAAEHCRLKPG